MIKVLRLKDYGKFRDEKLHFEAFTVITGPNEAGKTTVFDAIFDAVCADHRHEGRLAWKVLAGRYGPLRKADIEWEEGFSPVTLNDDQFLEIFSVRAGDTSVNVTGNNSWQSTAEARLLNSGLNPAQFAAAMQKKADTSGKGSIKARARELNKLIKELEPELAELKAKKNTIFEGEAEQARLEEALKKKQEELDTRHADLKALREQAEQLSMSCRLAAAEAGLKALRELKEVRAEMARLVKFAMNETSAYKALAHEAAGHEKNVSAAEAALGEKKAAALSVKQALDALVARQPVLAKQRDTAEALSSRIAAYLAEPPKVESRVVKPMRYALWAGALALAGFVAYSGRNNGAYAAAGVIVIAGAFVGWKLSIKERLVPHTDAENKALLDGLAAEWAVASEEPLAAASVDDARAFLAKAGADAAAQIDSIKPRADEYAGLEGAMKAAERTFGELKDKSAAAAKRAADWLKERGCATEEEYHQGLADHARFTARAGDILERVRIFKERYKCAEDDQIRDRLLMEKEALDHKGVDAGKADEPELERMKAREQEMLEEMRAVEGAASEVKSGIEKAKAVAGAKLEGLPERINRAETRISVAKEELAELDLQGQAYMLASEVFNKLAEKSTAAFEELGKEVTALLRGVLPGASTEFVSFDAAEAEMTDAGGHLRPARYLSSGTKDLFMLAARLVMARKARQADDGTLFPALLVLDDPFYTLDHGRTASALKLLAQFQNKTGWQMVVLTKDFTLADTAREAGLDVLEQKLV